VILIEFKIRKRKANLAQVNCMGSNLRVDTRDTRVGGVKQLNNRDGSLTFRIA
jgi:hypothetical protein